MRRMLATYASCTHRVHRKRVANLMEDSRVDRSRGGGAVARRRKRGEGSGAALVRLNAASASGSSSQARQQVTGGMLGEIGGRMLYQQFHGRGKFLQRAGGV